MEGYPIMFRDSTDVSRVLRGLHRELKLWTGHERLEYMRLYNDIVSQSLRINKGSGSEAA